MTISYTWQITTDVIPEHVVDGQTYHNVVETVHWRLRGVDDTDGLSAEVYGAVSLNVQDVDASTFIHRDNLDGKTIAQWGAAVLEAQAKGEVDRRKQQVADRIAKKRNPPRVPWTPDDHDIPDSEVTQ
jgi:hypothetical protein